MEKNLSKLDRQIRMVLGVTLIMLGGIKVTFFVGVVGFIIMATGLYSFCPLYKLLKIDTLNRHPKK